MITFEFIFFLLFQYCPKATFKTRPSVCIERHTNSHHPTVHLVLTDMRIVPLGYSSTNLNHWRVPQKSVIQGWGVVYFGEQTKCFHSYCKVTKNQASMELCTCLFHTQLKNALAERPFDCLDLSLFVTSESVLFSKKMANNSFLQTLRQW